MNEPGINASTRVCGVFGWPIRHSASPAMHNAAFGGYGMNWKYLAFEVRPEKLREALLGARSMGLMGVNLTLPHKLLAMEMMDVLDGTALEWGAVNTVRFEGRAPDGSWHPLAGFDQKHPLELRSQGFNTDAAGLEMGLREDLQLDMAGLKVIVLGAGGAGRMAALKCASAGAQRVHVINRTAARAAEVAVETARRFPSATIKMDYPSDSVDLLINATSLGLNPGDELPFDSSVFSLSRVGAVYDMIYKPAETRLIAAAKKAGCRTANGTSMLAGQGALAFELWTGKPGPLIQMKRAAEQMIYGNECHF